MLDPERKRRRSLIPLFLTFFLDNFGLAIIYPIFTPLVMNPTQGFFAEESSFLTKTFTLGLLIGIFPLAQFLGSPLIGQYSDRYGRKRSFYFTLLGTTIGYFLTGCAILYHSFHLLFLSRALTGLCAGNLPLCFAALADMCPDEKMRAKQFGYISGLGGLSFILAILLGGLLSDPLIYRHFNPALPFWITSLLSLATFLLMALLFHETHITHPKNMLHPFEGVQNLKKAIQEKDLRVLYACNFFFKISWVASMQFLPTILLQTYRYSSTQITYILLGVGGAWTFANLVLNRKLALRVYPGKSLLASLGILSLLTFLTGAFFPIGIFLPLFYFSVTTAALSWTTGMSTLSLKAPAKIQGSLMGINQSLTSLASMIAPLIAGILLGIRPVYLYLFCGSSALAAFLILRFSRAYRPTPIEK